MFLNIEFQTIFKVTLCVTDVVSSSLCYVMILQLHEEIYSELLLLSVISFFKFYFFL